MCVRRGLCSFRQAPGTHLGVGTVLATADPRVNKTKALPSGSLILAEGEEPRGRG